MNQPVNVYGKTEYRENGVLESIFDGFGYRDEYGDVTWYGAYNPPMDNDSFETIICPYGNGCDLSEIQRDRLMAYIKNPPAPTTNRNRMGCSENWYDSFFAIKETFSIEEVESMTSEEIYRLIRLADNIAEHLY